ncbi:hypothetical protein [Acinetobacter amyesii]|uniref:hypothetical protein n=1 Tax=Acinetobacter amyesii TaxID=2942470 RepID=UPI003F00B952
MEQEKFKQDIVIQLPWTVPQQQNVQTLVIQQPAKTHMELNASTDKTAISSFALSVIVALILGGLATWLAYWYGRKSFQLTDMSFKTVVEEIKASQQSALDINAKLFEQQSILQSNELHYSYKVKELEKLRKIVAEYLSCLIDFNISITMNIKELDREELIKEVVKYNLRVANYHQQIELFLDFENDEYQKNIKKTQTYLLSTLWDVRKEFENGESRVGEKITYFSLACNDISALLHQYLLNEVKKVKGE